MDITTLSKDFPILSRKINGKNLVYLDNAATSQTPKQVMDVWVDYYSNHRANVHRGIHTLSEESTEMYENSKKSVAKFIGCKADEVIYVRNATEACNLVAYAFLPLLVKEGDTIVISESEHHSNIIPWQLAAKRLKLNVQVIPLDEKGTLDISVLKDLDYAFIAINQVSNFLGTINPIKEIIELSRKKGAKVFIDGAQGIPHIRTNVTSLDCDFYAFSGHKIYAPFGIGALYIKASILEKAQPFLTGGGMIEEVYVDNATFLPGAEMFDAGTPNVGGSIALGAAIEYFITNNKDDVLYAHEEEILDYLLSSLSSDSDIEIYGPQESSKRAGLVSFNVKKVHSHDLSSILDTEGIAVRSGHHCTMPAHIKMDIPASTRASIGIYNTKEDVDALMEGIKKAKKIFS